MENNIKQGFESYIKKVYGRNDFFCEDHNKEFEEEYMAFISGMDYVFFKYFFPLKEILHEDMKLEFFQMINEIHKYMNKIYDRRRRRISCKIFDMDKYRENITELFSYWRHVDLLKINNHEILLRTSPFISEMEMDNIRELLYRLLFTKK